MVPDPSPIPAPQVGSFGPPTAALTGVVAVGSRPEHCARRFSKLACTSAESVSVHVPVPRQAAPHPEKVASAAGVAVSAMEVPVAAVIAQVPGQSIPEGFDITRPVPLPDGVTLTRKVPNDGTEKVAATWWSAFIGSEQAAVPEQSPCHPRNVEPASAVAVSRTVPPPVTSTRHSVRHDEDGLALCTAPPAETRMTSECDPEEADDAAAPRPCMPHADDTASSTRQPIDRIPRPPPDERSLAEVGRGASGRQRTVSSHSSATAAATGVSSSAAGLATFPSGKPWG